MGWSRGSEDILFWKNHWIFRFVVLSSEISDKMKLHPWKISTKLLHPLEFPGQKIKPFFITTPGNSSSSLIDPLNSYIIFFQYTPKKFHVLVLPPLVRIFSVTQLSHKIQTGGAEDIVFWKSPSGIFSFVTLTLEILEKTSFNP